MIVCHMTTLSWTSSWQKSLTTECFGECLLSPQNCPPLCPSSFLLTDSAPHWSPTHTDVLCPPWSLIHRALHLSQLMRPLLPFRFPSETHFWDDSFKKLNNEYPLKEKMGRNDAYQYQQQLLIILLNNVHYICCGCNMYHIDIQKELNSWRW